MPVGAEDASTSTAVIPAKAGTHFAVDANGEMDPRCRGDDIEDGMLIGGEWRLGF